MGNINAMVQYVKDTCADPSVGYSQVHRWRDPDVDCSSFMYLAANAAGYNIGIGSGYTGTMLNDFRNAGFTVLAFDGNINDLDAGDIMLNVQNHTEMYVGGGQFGGAHIDENGGIAGNQRGDQTGNEVSIVPAYVYYAGWDYVLVPPRDNTVNPPAEPQPVKDFDVVAKEIIAGVGGWGNNPERAQKLTAAGYNAEQVQNRVNEIIARSNANAGNTGASAEDAVESAAWDIINYGTHGKYGNEPERSVKLKAAGIDPVAVQKRINQLLGK